MKTALITGIAGQDGSYLAELLLEKGYVVHGLVKNIPEAHANELWRIGHILEKLVLHGGDVSDHAAIRALVAKIQPDEIYHLATKHELKNSLENYLEIQATNIDSTYYLLSSIKEIKPSCKFFFASSSKVFGKAETSPQNEETPLAPNSLYAISKVQGMHLVKMFREEGIFGCSGILYNHESPRRDPFFLPRKITSTAAKIKLGKENELRLGDLDAKRDWGFAGDYVECMRRMLQMEKPEDYVIGTGEVHSVRDVLDVAFGALGLDWQKYVVRDPALVAMPEPVLAVADITKAKKKLGWEPGVKFEDLIKMMIEEDMRLSEVK